MKRTQLNIALTLIAVGLGAAVFFSQKKEEPKGAPLTALKADAINHIVISHPGKPEIRMDKQGGVWKLFAPVQADVDSVELEQVLALAAAETKSTLDPAQVKKEELGLNPPIYTVTLNDVNLGFGAIESLKYLRYVDTGGKIGLIDDPSAMPLDDDYSDLVSKALLPAGSQIERIDLPGNVSVARNADGKGWSATPAQPALTSDALQKLVDAWDNTHSMWNQYAATPATQGDAVRIALKGGSVLDFRVISREPQFVLERADLKIRYTIGKDEAPKLLQIPEAKPTAPTTSSSAAAPATSVAPKP